MHNRKKGKKKYSWSKFKLTLLQDKGVAGQNPETLNDAPA